MPNAYFQFRQFTIFQDRCAMKICTDTCLFGAWLAGRIKDARYILDIGAGSGVLSIMTAQKTSVPIDAVEIDTDAAMQAAENFQASPWKERLKVMNMPVQEYAASFSKSNNPLYDLIISNPPFYSNELKSPDSKKNIAMHGNTMSFEELINAVDKLLTPDGVFGVIVPYHRSAFLENLASGNGFYVAEKINVRQTSRHTFFRSMYLFCRMPDCHTSVSEITIKDDSLNYTRKFSEIMEDYYLVLDKAS